MMAKKRATAEEIRAELRQRIEACGDLDGSCRGCGVPIPRITSQKQLNGPNWGVEGFPDLAPGCFGVILRIVD